MIKIVILVVIIIIIYSSLVIVIILIIRKIRIVRSDNNTIISRWAGFRADRPGSEVRKQGH